MTLKDSWNELIINSRNNFAYFRHEWFEHWMIDFDRTNGIFVVTAWDNNKLIAIAPLKIYRDTIKNLPVRVLSFMESSISPRINFIFNHPSITDNFFDFIISETKGWDLFIARNLQQDSPPTKSFLEYLNNKDKSFTIETGRQSPYLLLDKSWDEYYGSLTKSFKKAIRRSINRLEKAESYELNKFTSFDQIEGIFDDFISISGKSWKTQLGTDLLSRKSIAEFYRNFSRNTDQSGLWEVHALKINGVYVAFNYLLKGEKRVSGIRTDFDQKYKFYMPGYALKINIIKDLINRKGTWEYDFGGVTSEYKLEWTDMIRKHINITVYQNSLYGKILMKGKKLLSYFNNETP